MATESSDCSGKIMIYNGRLFEEEGEQKNVKYAHKNIMKQTRRK